MEKLVLLDDRHKLPASILSTDVGFLLTRKYSKGQSGHNDTEAVPGGPLGYFMSPTCRETSLVWRFLGLHHHLFYDECSKLALVEHLKMEGVMIPLFSVTSGHSHAQHFGLVWEELPCLQYHVYVVPQGVALRHAIAFAYFV